MIKKIYISLLFFSCLYTLQAQQIGIYSHTFYKPMISNPAFTAGNESTNAMLISRSQWIDFKNAPQLNLFTLDGMLPNKKMGIGVDLFTDKKGISNKIGGNLYYSYWLKLNDQTKLTFGIALGLTDYTLHYSEAIIEDPSDPFIIGTSQRETNINANAGLGFIWKKLEVGIAVPQLLGSALEYQDNTTGKANYSLDRHYQGTLKYSFLLLKDKQIFLTPMAAVHFLPNAPFQYDANLNLEWKDKFWVGATYKSDYAVAANAGICIGKKFYVGYSYDIIIGNIGQYSGMSHELMLNFVFGKTKEKEEKIQEIAISKDKEKTDSLLNELEIKENKLLAEQEKIRENQEKTNELNKELAKLKAENEQLKKAPVTTEIKTTTETPSDSALKDNSNQNAVSIADNKNKVMENGVWIASVKTEDFSYLNGKPASKGFYVVTGTFFYRDFAENELKKMKTKGFSKANILYSSSKQFNYVAAAFHSNKADALIQVGKLKADGIKDAWILSVQE